MASLFSRLEPRVRKAVEAEKRASLRRTRTVVVDPFADLEAAAEQQAETWTGLPLDVIPSRSLAIVTCMDGRVDPVAAFGLARGDAHIIRNAGARVSDDVIRSLIVSTVRMGVTRVAVVHHTGCGATDISHLQMCDHVLASTGVDPAGIDFMFFPNQPHTLRSDINLILACPYIPPGTSVAGYLYDTDRGRLTRATPTMKVTPHLKRGA